MTKKKIESANSEAIENSGIPHDNAIKYGKAFLTSFALTISAGIGFAYGLFRFFKDESALYVRMIVFGVGCAMLGRLFATLLYLVNGELFDGFNVGMLGIIGSFLFFFSANFGQMDAIVDDGSPKFRKTRIIALAAPLTVAALWYAIFAVYGFNEVTISTGVEALFFGFGILLSPQTFDY